MSKRVGRRAVLAAVAGSMVLGTTLSSCSLFTDAEGPEATAQALAEGLDKGSLKDLSFTSGSAAQADAFYAKAVKGMGDMPRDVTLINLTKTDAGDQATATIATRWDVPSSSKDWGYETDVQLRRTDSGWSVVWKPSIVAPDLTTDEVLGVQRTWPKRAPILDAAGAPIVTEREVADVGIDKAKAGAKSAASATALASLLGLDAKEYAAKVAAAGPAAFVPAVTLRVEDPLLSKNVKKIDAIPGGARIGKMAMLGPSRTFAAPVLGSVSEASAEQIQKSNGVLVAGDQIGQNGLQFRYDAQLRGTAGMAIQARKIGADGSVIDRRELFAQASSEGKPLQITLETKAQTAAEAALAKETKTPTGMVVVRVSTGEIIAAAVGPGAKGSTLALAGKAPPGSTFKIVSSLAMIRKGATADTKFPCTNTLNVNGRVFGNYTEFPRDHVGDIALKTALAYSCNTAFISQYKTVSQADLIAAADSLGLNVDADLPFTGFLGSVPPTDDQVMHAATFIGQGQVEASPLAMALVTASVMKGETVRPKLVLGSPALPAPKTPLTAAEAKVLQTEMAEVVGVGSGKRLAAVGVQYAKTGTAEFGTKNPPQTHAWMVAGKGDLAIAAYNELGPSGSTHAGPFIAEFLKAYEK